MCGDVVKSPVVLTEGQDGFKETCTDLTNDYMNHTCRSMTARSLALAVVRGVLKPPCTPFSV